MKIYPINSDCPYSKYVYGVVICACSECVLYPKQDYTANEEGGP